MLRRNVPFARTYRAEALDALSEVRMVRMGLWGFFAEVLKDDLR